MTPEQKARHEIDRQLVAAGWIVQDFRDLHITAGLGVAVREFPLKTGSADYLLYVDAQIIGVIEAKPEGHTLTGVETQSSKYTSGMPTEYPHYRLPLPFAYESTGAVTQFTNTLNPDARSREVFTFHQPDELLRLVELDVQVRERLQQMPELKTLKLWPVQVEAIQKLEQSLAQNRPRALIQMATGSGKTFTAASFIYRIKAARQPVVQKSPSTAPPRRVPKEITHRRAAVVAYVISHVGQSGSTPHPGALPKGEGALRLGRTKLGKALYIAQTHEELDLQFRFQRYAAGPFDEALFKLERTAKKNEWFATKERDNFGVTYHAAAKTEPMSQQAARFLGDKQASFDRLVGHIDTMDMCRAELFATAYAAWNDLLIDGREITDNTIIDEFYAWDESKQKFTRAAIRKQLKWMRTEGYVPSGKGQRTEKRTKQTKLPSRHKKKD